MPLFLRLNIFLGKAINLFVDYNKSNLIIRLYNQFIHRFLLTMIYLIRPL
jgi:hypothetical protein